MQHRLIIALPNRLLAVALGQYVVQWSTEVEVLGVATDNKELFELLENNDATTLLYDPYLPGPCPQVICARLKNEFTNLNIILMKNENANGRFSDAEKCRPTAIIGSDAQPEELLQLMMMVSKPKSKTPPVKAKKIKKRKPKQPKKAEPVNVNAVLTQREQEMVSLIARGHSSREIAFVLDISVNTARNHTQNILKKLNLSKKIQLISWHISK